jgi:hypothetical protein
VRGHGEANYFRDYKRLEAIAKLATSYMNPVLTGVFEDQAGKVSVIPFP